MKSKNAKKVSKSKRTDAIETTPTSSDDTMDTMSLSISSNRSEDSPTVPLSRKSVSKEPTKQKNSLKQYKYKNKSKQSTTSPYFKSKRKRSQTKQDPINSETSQTSPVQSSDDDFRPIAKKLKESLSPVSMETESPPPTANEENINSSSLLYSKTCIKDTSLQGMYVPF